MPLTSIPAFANRYGRIRRKMQQQLKVQRSALHHDKVKTELLIIRSLRLGQYKDESEYKDLLEQLAETTMWRKERVYRKAARLSHWEATHEEMVRLGTGKATKSADTVPATEYKSITSQA